MSRNRPIAIALLVAASISQVSFASAMAATSQAGSASKFAAMADEFMKESLARSPVTASQVGYHKHTLSSGKTVELDALFDDMSEPAMRSLREFYSGWQKRFHNETPVSGLNAEDAADWQLVDDQISLQLLEFDKIQNYKHNPTVVVEMVGNAIYQPLMEEYAAKDVRLGHILSRLEKIPQLLEQVQTYLGNADPIYVDTAIEENDGNIDLIKTTLAAEIPAGSPLRERFDKSAPAAIASLQSFTEQLKSGKFAGAKPLSWRLGPELYGQKFRYVMETDVLPKNLLADAEQEVTNVRAEMLKLAEPMHKQMYPDHSDHSDVSGRERENLVIGEVLQKISDNHPKPELLQQAVEADLEAIKQFIREKKVVALSARDNLKVVPTPPFQRGIYSVAGFHSAPPLNPQATAEYWVTPIDPSTPAAKVESKLREYNNFTLKWLTIHEALPGHYIQFEHLNNIQPESRRLLRSLYANGAYVEGWAEYIAQVMMDEGFMKDDPRFRLIMRKIRLRVMANTILDIRMHTLNMTDEEALDLMTKKTFQTQAEAEGKLKRAKLSSTQLPTYYAGLREWLQFRQDYQKKAGASFDLQKFHDRVLDEGPVPVQVLRKLMEKEPAK